MSNPNAKYIERFEQLIRVLRGLSRHEREKHLDMNTWGEETECGTTCCAAGFAGLDPWFKRRGFSLKHSHGPTKVVATRNNRGWDAVKEFFGYEPDYIMGPAFEVFQNPNTVGEVIKAAQKRIKELQA